MTGRGMSGDAIQKQLDAATAALAAADEAADPQERAYLVAKAQVHATLAVAEASARPRSPSRDELFTARDPAAGRTGRYDDGGALL